MSDEWELWDEFCDSTNREVLWATKCIDLLQELNLIPSGTIVDAGCGNGVFTSCFKPHCSTLVGLDSRDFRTSRDFEFFSVGFESYSGPKPDILIFKQSFHLIPEVWRTLEKFKDSKLLIIQMPKPEYMADEERAYEREPFNAKANSEVFASLGREVILKTEVLELPMKRSLYERLIKGAYHSGLRKMTQEERDRVWDSLNVTEEDAIFRDELDLLLVL